MPTRWEHLRRDYATCLRAECESPNTVRLYLGAVDKLHTGCLANHGPDDPTEISRITLSAFMAGLTDTWKPATCSLTFRALQQFFGWLVREEAMARSPMQKMRPPHVPEQPTPVLTDEELRRLLASCSGKGFTDRRDTALVRLFLDTGCRRSEIANLTVEDTDMTDQSLVVVDKGNRIRVVPFGHKTAQALGRYLRLREQDRWATLSHSQ